MKIKFNWGTGILITFTVFMLSVIIQVIFYMNVDVDLVTDNYYDKELTYDDHIMKVKNASELRTELNISYSGEEVIIDFPEDISPAGISGDILFYRPSDPAKDFNIRIITDSNGRQRISTSGLVSGFWKIKVSWQGDDKSFYSEKELFIN